MGTPDFAVPSLRKLITSQHEVAAVVTGPDKPAGRGRKMRPTPVKKTAMEFNLPVLTPAKFLDEKFISALKEFQADLFVVVAFRILPKQVFTIPLYGTINLHSSLLPKYRGAAPINWVIINGEKETGVTTFFLEEKVDTGEWILQEKVSIGENETAGELHDRLSEIGAEVLLETVNLIDQGNAPRIKQEGEVSKAPKLNKELCRINWSKEAVTVFNQIRGLSPYPGAYSLLKKKVVKIFRAEVESGTSAQSVEPGKVISVEKEKILVGTGNGILAITELQPENRRRMTTAEYLRGSAVSPGDRFV